MSFNKIPLVSIECLVYNHAPFLRHCLDGFVMQKTDFPFEAIVHDDASTDNSAEIIREYAEKYPDIIKPIYETENQYSKKDGSLSRIVNEAMHPEAKYVALCEGDDYWVDPLKLQKQVDFMESNKEYSMCFHRVKIEAEEEFLRHQYDHLQGKDYSSNEILAEWTVPTCSVLLRKEVLRCVPKDSRFLFGDIVCFLSAGECGRMYCLSDCMGVYRRLSTGMMMGTLIKDENTLKWILHYQAIKEHFPKAEKSAKRLISLKMLQALRLKWKENKLVAVWYGFSCCYQERWTFFRILLGWFKHLILQK